MSLLLLPPEERTVKKLDAKKYLDILKGILATSTLGGRQELTGALQTSIMNQAQSFDH